MPTLKVKIPMDYYKFSNLLVKTEQDILSDISYKLARNINPNSMSFFGSIDITLQTMINDSKIHIENIINKQYIKGKVMGIGSAGKMLNFNDNMLINNIVNDLLSKVVESSITLQRIITYTYNDSLRLGRQDGEAQSYFLKAMNENRLTAFIDESGRRWDLKTYLELNARNLSQIAENIGILMADEEQDLYQVSSHNTSCPICAPYEGRVFSKSGDNNEYPAIIELFGKINKNGPDTIENSWLNIHPNCLHEILKYTLSDKTDEQIQKDKDFSSFSKNPINRNTQSFMKQLEYKNKQKYNQMLLENYKQFQRYKIIIGSQMPKTFNTFLKHKSNNSKEYKKWKKIYRKHLKDINEVV